MLVTAGVVFLIVVGFVAGCGGEEAPSSSADGVDEQAGAEQEEEPAKEEESAKADSAEESAASIGDPVTVGNVRWTVTKAEWSDILVSNNWGTEEGTFVILNVDFSNGSNQDIRLATPLLALVDSQGREFEPDINLNFYHVFPEENMFIGKVEPGTTKEGMIIFDVDPSTNSGFKFRAGEAKFGSNETRDIDLGTLPKAY